MTNLYHDTVPAPYRIQKRLVLNRCFKTIWRELGSDPPVLTYVTLGGADLYDVLDLLCVFDVTRTSVDVVSFEVDQELAERAGSSAVVQTLAQLRTFSAEIVPYALREPHLDTLAARRDSRPFIYFLDYTAPFGTDDRDVLLSLLLSGDLRAGDFVMITSCLTPRVLHQPTFMANHTAEFRTFFRLSEASLDRDFKVRNHVDLFVAQATAEYRKYDGDDSSVRVCQLLGKYRYRDTRAPMGVWLYRVDSAVTLPAFLHDEAFQEYPWSMEASAPAEIEGEVDLFTDI